MALLHSLTLSPESGAARHCRAAFSPILEGLDLPADVRDGFLLAMSELVTNLDRHSDPKPGRICVSFSRSRGAWQLEVADDGPPFDTFDEVVSRRLDIENLHESGMGLQLIRERFPDLSYVARTEAGGDWNRMIVRRELAIDIADRPEIMVVDDDPVFLKVIDGYLRESFTVIGLSSVGDAVAHLDRGGTALIISDIHMPGTDGYDFRRQVQSRPDAAELPFILLTGSSSELDREAAIDLSIDDYLTKPVDKRRLIATIRRVLKRTSDVRNRIGDRLDTEITQALEPRFDRSPTGFSAAVAFQAAAPGGGDVLIETSIDGGHLIVLADIMGHGEQAKFFAHALSGFVYGAVHGLSSLASPGQLLSSLSRLFAQDKVLSRSLATALVLVCDERGRIDVAAAGHPPPLILRPDRIEEADVGGPILGLLDDVDYQVQQIRLAPGERLIIYTDGVSEAGRMIVADPSELLGLPLERAAAASDEDVVSAMLDRARLQSAGGLEDDATAIVLRRNDD